MTYARVRGTAAHLLPGGQLGDDLWQQTLPPGREVMRGDDGQGLADLRPDARRRVQHQVDDEALDLLLHRGRQTFSRHATTWAQRPGTHQSAGWVSMLLVACSNGRAASG